MTSRLGGRSDALAAALADRYRLERELGAGGMATVYLAEDVRHHRRVAIKVLHPELAAVLGPERFLKEIELTASLQHAHILPLFDSGSADGLLFYVMPYVEGESLRTRLKRERQLPVDEAVRLAREVADALDYAHRRGVVHRDVKPENILLHDGRALVADFGIAVAVQQAGGVRLTETGLSLGTPQYMAPEQAAGERTVDARADVYALGAVTYEVLAGEPPFTAASAQAVIAKLMTDDPTPLTRHRRSVPPHVEAAVLRALEKLPADRFPSAGAFAAALGEPAAALGAALPHSVERGPRGRQLSRRAAAVLASGTLAAGVALGWALGRTSAGPVAMVAGRGPVRFAIEVDSGWLGNAGPAISPDGRTIVYAAGGADGARLYARRLDDLAARPLAGTEDGEQPFFSPDGGWVAFYSHGALRKVPLGGGPAVVITAVPPPAWFGGGSWGQHDTIFYALPFSPSGSALYRVPAGGGVGSRIAVADTGLVSIWKPYALPGGRAVLVTHSDWSYGDHIGVLDLASGRLRKFGPGSAPRYVAGTIFYGGAEGELYRRPFDLERLEPTGTAEQIASGLAFLMDPGGTAFDVASTGTLVYRVGRSLPSRESLKLTDRAGRQLQQFPARMPWAPRFSPDGRRVAYGAFAPGHDAADLWIIDLDAGTTQRLTADGNNNNDAQWSPDGKVIAYSANEAEEAGGKDVFVQALDGRPARHLMRRPGFQFPTDWLRDGSAVLFLEMPLAGDQAGNQDVWVQPTDGGEARPYVATPAQENGARVSPDGRWVAYMSNETGRAEVYVQSYPAPGRKVLVSARGGIHPVWRGDGRELYYWQADQLIAASIDAGGAGKQPVVRSRTPLFRAPYPGGPWLAMYDVSPDGTRFILAAGHERENRLVVALDVVGDGAAPESGRP